MLQVGQNPNIYSTTAQTPASFQSRIVIPNGQPFVPQFVYKPAVPQIAPLQSIQYAQAAPYINTGSNVFKPCTETISGHSITPLPQNMPKTDDAVVIYQGPLKTITPQMTPIEQFDNDIEKKNLEYAQTKKEVNKEMEKIMGSLRKEKKSSLLADLAKFFAIVLVGLGVYKYRSKIPLIKNIFRR